MFVPFVSFVKDKVSTSKTKSMRMHGNEIRRLKIVIEGKIIEQVTLFKYLGNKISEYNKDMEYRLQAYNVIYGIMKRNFDKRPFKQNQEWRK
jgi:hypothetical protein